MLMLHKNDESMDWNNAVTGRETPHTDAHLTKISARFRNLAKIDVNSPQLSWLEVFSGHQEAHFNDANE